MSDRIRFIRPYLVSNYPCPADEGGCGVAVGKPCITKAGRASANPHAPRWRAHDRARGGTGRAVITRELPDAPGTLIMLRNASQALAQAQDLLTRALQDLGSAP